MKVLFDNTIFSFQVFGGISHYFVQLLNHLPKEIESKLAVVASENEYLPSLNTPISYFKLRHFPDHKKIYNLINSCYERYLLKKDKYELMHPTDYYGRNILGIHRIPYVITVHDLQFIQRVRNGELSKEKGRQIREVIENASRIIAISKTTKDNLISSMEINPDKVDIVYHGFSPFTYIPDRPKWLPERYILFVGNRGDYKNFNTFFQAFEKLAEKEINLKLVCTGKKFSTEEKEMIARSGLTGRVIQKMVTQAEMPALYKYAVCFVFPSKMEGFGMPILEAFSAGCPIAMSDMSCLPEIGGSGGVYFNPEDPEEMTEVISRLIEDKNFRDESVAYGYNRLKDFSWARCGKETADVYHKALNGI